MCKNINGFEILFQVKLVRPAKRVYRHKSYSPHTIINDIALVKLKRELPLGEFIKRVILRPTSPKQDKKGILAGWGAIDVSIYLGKI